MCGIVGIMGVEPVNVRLYDALTVLQHRGQDAAGIATAENYQIHSRKENGLVKDVFRTRHMRDLVGNMGLGHVRYPTAGQASAAEAQPFSLLSPYPIALAHNGNLVNVNELRQDLFEKEGRVSITNSDSEVILNVFAAELLRGAGPRPTEEDVFRAVRKVHSTCKGGYAVTVMIPSIGIVGFRDTLGIRPITYGRRETDKGTELIIASESVALDILGFEQEGDIAPGEAIICRTDGTLSRRACADETSLNPCVFEYVYLARPDSIIDGISVYKTRLRMGDYLANKITREWPEHDIDVVIPVPDTSRSAAIQMAHHLGVKYREGFIKNRYIGRTFIMPGQAIRKKSVRKKLNAIDLEFQGKNVLLVDDSIVRGTTCSQIIQMARDAGAKKVYFASAAPAIRYPNVYGIDMPAASELIGHGRSVEEIREAIGADKLIYQDIEDLHLACQGVDTDVDSFEDSVFTGRYLSAEVDQDYLDNLEAARNDATKEGQRSAENEILA